MASPQVLREERWFSVLFLLVCCVTRLNTFKCLFKKENRGFHQYAQYLTSPWFLVPEGLALALSLYIHLAAPIPPLSPYLDIFAAVIMVANIPAVAAALYSNWLLHTFYVVSPARSGIIRQSYGSESRSDRLVKVCVYAYLLVALVVEGLWCSSIVLDMEGDPQQLKLQVFGCALLAIVLQRLVLAGFIRDKSKGTSGKREKADAPSTPERKTEASPSNKARSAQSALHNNIKQKGKHSYYYAHATTREEELNRGEPPKRLEVVEGDDRISTTLSPRKNLDAIRSYYFVDKESNVKIYIKEEACLSMEHELKWTPTSVRLTFGSKLVLHLPKLFEEIKDARVKRLETKVVLVLLKENPDISWNRLA